MLTILIVEDDTAIRDMLHSFLTAQQFDVITAENGKLAFEQMAERNPDLVLLDWMLPDFSGPDLLKMMRGNAAQKEIPVIMLTAKSEEEDKIRGLQTGADDYMTKPFSLQELLARIHALLRRSHRLDENKCIQAGSLVLDPGNQAVTVDGQTITMGPTEFRLLHYLLRTPGRLHSRSHLLDQVWGQGSFIEERTVDVHILRLRKLLKKHGVTGLIETVRGGGYRLRETGHEA